MELKTGKFIFRIVISILVFGFGVAIFFISADPNLKSVGVGLTSMVFGTWMSSGSTTIKHSLDKKKKTTLDAVVIESEDISENKEKDKDISEDIHKDKDVSEDEMHVKEFLKTLDDNRI